MSSSSLVSDEYKMDKQIQEWHKMAQSKLKIKITNNIQKRAVATEQCINYALKHLISDTHSNHIWFSLYPSEAIEKYESIFPAFTIPKKLIDDALHELLSKVDNWSGVDINCMNQRPKTFKKYWTLSGEI